MFCCFVVLFSRWVGCEKEIEGGRDKGGHVWMDG